VIVPFVVADVSRDDGGGRLIMTLLPLGLDF